MSGICGWFDPTSGGAIDPAAIGSMAAVLTQFDASPLRTVASDRGAVAVAGRSVETDIFQSSDRLCAVWGNVRFGDAQLQRLARERGMACALGEAYARKGNETVRDLQGHFAVALLDYKSATALLAIDRVGTRPMCYATVGGRLVFGTSLDSISDFPGIDNEINRQSIYDYVYFHMVPGPKTIYVHRQRLLPGSFLTWSASAEQIHSYWEMRFVEDETRPFPELRDEFLSLLRKSVADCVEGDTTGAFLSGGTDSSTVAGMLREVTGKAPRTYSIGFEAQGFDEMSYARVAARHFGTLHHEYYVTPDDVVAAIPRIAEVHDQPFGNSSAVPTYFCAKLAKDDGILTLLGGDGGDELFGGNARYATQYLYSLYSDLPSTLRKGMIEPLISLLPSAGVSRKLQRYIATASIPMPARYENYNLLDRLGAHKIFTKEFLSAIDQDGPAEHIFAWYNAAQAQSLINRMLALDSKITLADNDLLKVLRSCELGGVAARFPLLADEVVAFSTRLQPDQKIRRTALRYFFKKSLADFLPEEIIRKSKHGFGLPFGEWVTSHAPLQALAMDSLSRLKSRSIVQSEFVDELIGVHVKEHPNYFGTLVWVFMMLELWLQRSGA